MAINLYRSGGMSTDTFSQLVWLNAYCINTSTPYSGMFKSGTNVTSAAAAYTPTSGKNFYMTRLTFASTVTSSNFAVAIGYSTASCAQSATAAPGGTVTQVIGNVNGAATQDGKSGFIMLGAVSDGATGKYGVLYEGTPILIVPSSASGVYPFISMYIGVSGSWSFYIEGFES